MRLTIFYLTAALHCGAQAQIALDDLFINERFIINAEASLLEYHGVDRTLVFEHAERIRTYAVDEPYQWVKRYFFRIDPKDNPVLTVSIPADSILPFVDIVDQAIASGAVMLFRDLDYVGSDEVRGKEPIISAPIILKVDFHIDTLTHMAVPHLVGLSVERPDGGYAHMYYPELSHVLRKYGVHIKHGLINYDELFKGFHFKATLLGCEEVASAFACKPVQPSLEQQSELDALSELYLLEHVLERDAVIRSGKRSTIVDLHPLGPVKANVVFDKTGELTEAELKKDGQLISSMHFKAGRPDGPYRAFHPDGGLREEGFFAAGLRQGIWNSWFPGGIIRSHRSYKQGHLNGRQQVYHPNGKMWLEYDMMNGEYEGAHTTWYPDGELKASGSMRDGFISGEWDYAIRIDQALMMELDKNNATLYHLPEGVWQDGVLNYHVTITDDGRSGSNCIFGRCIQYAYSNMR